MEINDGCLKSNLEWQMSRFAVNSLRSYMMSTPTQTHKNVISTERPWRKQSWEPGFPVQAPTWVNPIGQQLPFPLPLGEGSACLPSPTDFSEFHCFFKTFLSGRNKTDNLYQDIND